MANERHDRIVMQLKLNRTQIVGALLLAGVVLLILLFRYWALPK